MLRSNDMSQVPDQGEVQDEGPYLVRVSEVLEFDEEGEQLLSDKGEPKVIVTMKIQDEGKWFGTRFQAHCSLQPHALWTLKAIYKAAGYTPGPEGHDPQKILDAEFYVYNKQRSYEDRESGEKRLGTDLKPWGYRSVSEGPAKPKNK